MLARRAAAFVLVVLLANLPASSSAGRDDPRPESGTLSMQYLPWVASSPPIWSRTGPQAHPRTDHAATLLPDGRVLVTGGGFYDTTSSAELYDPATNSWSLAAPMRTPRMEHTATLLPNGRVLVVGGWTSFWFPSHTSADLYDPQTGSWSPAAQMSTGRASHTATLLPSGKVLVAGGSPGGGLHGALSSTELYDPATNTWSFAGWLAEPRKWHTATLLPSGKVLIAGGGNPWVLKSAELYDPDTNTWAVTGSMAATRAKPAATLLPSGRVLVTGGWTQHGWPLDSAEIYDPASGVWTNTASMSEVRSSHTATLLPSGRVLLAGGNIIIYGSCDNGTAIEYDETTAGWVRGTFMLSSPWDHTATLLASGKVLVTGYVLAEVYDPAVFP